MQKRHPWIVLLMILLSVSHSVTGQEAWQNHVNNKSVSYKEALDFYHKMDQKYENAKMFTYGSTDCGKPLELMVISNNGFDRVELRKKGVCVILINNGIHPGEPDGIDASIILTHYLLTGSLKLPPNIVVAIIPVYNIDGALNRGCCSRANQDGPQLSGFRGNAKNLDLNRDFIKCDSKNARSFTSLYQAWDPDIFVDTHVSDGADYQHIITLIDSQKDKLQADIRQTMQSKLLPMLYRDMISEGYKMCPYVNEKKESPEHGIIGFLEPPRFASGYSALFNAFPFVVETHMLKPFPKRVESTYSFLKVMIQSADTLRMEILHARVLANAGVKTEKNFPLAWANDTTKADSIHFFGYTARYRKSSVTNMDQLYYDESAPYEKYIPYFNSYKAVASADKPVAYIIPQAWSEVIDRLTLNGVKMETLSRDTALNVEVYYIRDYKSGTKPYEGHYLHSEVQTDVDHQQLNYYKGDKIVYCNQSKNRYIIETLEPKGTDAFFAWNFFDAILQQKEWFSDYVFDPRAEDILAKNPQLKKDFDLLKKSDSSFANNRWAMLTYVYQHSEYYEKSHNRYPVARLQNDAKLPIEEPKGVQKTPKNSTKNNVKH